MYWRVANLTADGRTMSVHRLPCVDVEFLAVSAEAGSRHPSSYQLDDAFSRSPVETETAVLRTVDTFFEVRHCKIVFAVIYLTATFAECSVGSVRERAREKEGERATVTDRCDCLRRIRRRENGPSGIRLERCVLRVERKDRRHS